VGLKSRIGVLRLQRAVNEYAAEPLTAILPGAALAELWQLVGTAETALGAVSLLVIATALLGMVTSLLTTLNERRREMAILRSLGARPTTILGLLTAEAALLTALGIAIGVAALYLGLWVARPWIDRTYGLYLTIDPLDATQWTMLAAVLGVGVLGGLLPALRAYRMSVADGMTIKV
jgi:putative ABC transport system permease protein